jgi:hypothetical protein
VARALDAIRPHPHRGDIIAAGAVPFTLAILLVDLRFAGAWSAGVRLIVVGGAAAFVGTMAWISPREGVGPRAYQTVLYVAGLILLQAALLRLADVLGAGGGLPGAGTLVWTEAAVAGAAIAIAMRRNAASATLIAAVAGGAAALAFVRWAFDPATAVPSRWVLAGLIVIYGGGVIALRDRRRRHAVQLVSAAGIAALALVLSFAGAGLALGIALIGAGLGAAGWGWELLVLGVGFGLIAYAGADDEPGPAYLGTAALLGFVLLAAPPGRGGPSLLGWPAALLLMGVIGFVIGLRPRQPLPPEPDPGPPDDGAVVPGPAPTPGTLRGAGP